MAVAGVDFHEPARQRVWCTGFRPDFGWIELPVIGEDGWPQQTRGVVESAPGLYFLGLPFLYAFASMLVVGAARDAAYVTERVAGRCVPRSAQAKPLSEAMG